MAAYTGKGEIKGVPDGSGNPASLTYPSDLYWEYSDFLQAGWGPILYGGAIYAMVQTYNFDDRTASNANELDEPPSVVRSDDEGLTWSMVDPLGSKFMIGRHPANMFLICNVQNGAAWHCFTLIEDQSIAKMLFHLDTGLWEPTVVTGGPVVTYFPTGGIHTADTGLGGAAARLMPVRRSDGSFLIIYNQLVNVSGTQRKKVYAVTLNGTTWGTPISVDGEPTSTMSYSAVAYHAGAGDRTHVWMLDKDLFVRHAVVELSGTVSSRTYLNFIYSETDRPYAGQADISGNLIRWPSKTWASASPSVPPDDSEFPLAVQTIDAAPDISTVEFISLSVPLHNNGEPGGAWVDNRYYAAWPRSSDRSIVCATQKQIECNPTAVTAFSEPVVIVDGAIFDLASGSTFSSTVHARALPPDLGVMFTDNDAQLRFTLVAPFGPVDPCEGGGAGKRNHSFVGSAFSLQ